MFIVFFNITLLELQFYMETPRSVDYGAKILKVIHNVRELEHN